MSDHDRYANSMLPQPSDDAKALAEAFETFLLMAGDRPLWDGGLSKLARMFDEFAAQRITTERERIAGALEAQRTYYLHDRDGYYNMALEHATILVRDGEA